MDLPRIAAVASAFAVLTLLLLAGYWAISRARAGAVGTAHADPADELAELQAAYEAGQMSPEEFERVQQALRGRVTPVPRPPSGEPTS